MLGPKNLMWYFARTNVKHYSHTIKASNWCSKFSWCINASHLQTKWFQCMHMGFPCFVFFVFWLMLPFLSRSQYLFCFWKRNGTKKISRYKSFDEGGWDEGNISMKFMHYTKQINRNTRKCFGRSFNINISNLICFAWRT